MKYLEELDKKYILDTYNKRYIDFVKGQNATLYDESNQDYIDFTAGIGVCSVGHGNKQLADTLHQQALKVLHISNLFSIKPQILLAQKLALYSDMDIGVFFANSGAEANEGAIKIARKFGARFKNKKYKIITLDNSFHGRTITTLKATGQTNMHKSEFAPYPNGFVYAKDLEDIYNLCDDEVTAVMIELIQGEGGVNVFDKTQVQKLSKFLKSKNILLIVDEVQTGIYRTGEFLASNLFDITPDIITIAKGLGGGVPIGAVLTTHKDILIQGEHGSTFGGNFLSTSVSLKVLEILKDLKSNNTLDEINLYFEDKLKHICNTFKDIFQKVVGVGLMRGIVVKDKTILPDIIQKSFENKLLVLRAGEKTLRFLPPLTISKQEIDEGFKRLKQAIETL